MRQPIGLVDHGIAIHAIGYSMEAVVVGRIRQRVHCNTTMTAITGLAILRHVEDRMNEECRRT